jgi:hypothetical protein
MDEVQDAHRSSSKGAEEETQFSEGTKSCTSGRKNMFEFVSSKAYALRNIGQQKAKEKRIKNLCRAINLCWRSSEGSSAN